MKGKVFSNCSPDDVWGCFDKSVENVTQIHEKITRYYFLQEIFIFLLRKFPSTKQKFFVEKLPLIQKSSLKKLASGKNTAASRSSFLNYQNGIFLHIQKKLGNLPLPLQFFLSILAIYTASCTIFEIDKFKSRNICHHNIAQGLRLIASDIVGFL